MNHTLMFQGTTSDAGKSVLVAGMCRVLARRDIKVAPFKPQNMALNSAVTADGGEIGRAQAVQAQACYLEAHTDMNPILLKPNNDVGAQIIVHGKALCDMDACDFHAYKVRAMPWVLASFRRLQQQYDVIVVEGAGSPAEINLRDNDIANMGFAEAVDCPVVIVADIDRGGVFAHLVGTLELLSPSEQNRVAGFVINRFRGDISLLRPGIDWLEKKTAKPVLGVIPYLHGLHIEAEDAITTHQRLNSNGPVLKVAVPVLSRISNHTDFDALRWHKQVNLQFIGAGDSIPAADIIILPGTKSVRRDVEFLRAQSWHKDIERHLRYGGKVVGICGGYQMLGEELHDLHGVEGDPGSSPGLGFLALKTHIEKEKQLRRVKGILSWKNATVEGYEIHAGVTTGSALDRPLLHLDGRPEGAISTDNQIIGCYLHGFFDHPEALSAFLRWAGLPENETEHNNYHEFCEQQIDRLADAVEQHLDWHCLFPGLTNLESFRK